MTQQARQFPHIPRLFSASSGFILLWVALGITLAINMQHVRQPPRDSSYRPLLQSPFASAAHTQTALSLWDLGRHEEAKHEAAIAQDLSQIGGVLGTSTSAKELLNQWEAEPARLQVEYAYWENVAKQRPDYRDALVIAAAHAYMLGHTHQARTLIAQAAHIDPGAPAVQTWKTYIEKTEERKK